MGRNILGTNLLKEVAKCVWNAWRSIIFNMFLSGRRNFTLLSYNMLSASRHECRSDLFRGKKKIIPREFTDLHP